ncbi:predicted protein [Uncinocarpus reesii 1704]|uniref:Uncharacterized protein n=1 Tax=Uncinocarpus reesii (strain UAMH 1704) TaxID=336963 RepID=C4JMN9_UNCRE|nr:uncharacterized protein UREG_04097 [Uncinocarpus reesii 1704]EEP79251.1 predicted protein [Uncinocarpus reesii 1704]
MVWISNPEKQKYFKIQPNQLVPQGSKYSKQEVSKRQESAVKRKKLETFEDRVSTERIKPAGILRHPIIGKLGLQREIGQHRPRTSTFMQQCGEASVQLFERNTLLDLHTWDPRLIVRSVDRDPRTARIFTGLNIAGPSGFRYVDYRPIIV